MLLELTVLVVELAALPLDYEQTFMLNQLCGQTVAGHT